MAAKAKGKQRYIDVKDALSGKLTTKTRARLRKEYKTLSAKYEPKPYDPQRPLKGDDFIDQLDDIVGKEFDPQERALGQRAKDVPGWYQEYQDRLAANNASLNSAYQAQQDAAQTRATGMANEASTANTALFDKLRADAQQRGATLDPAIQEQAERARTNRQSLANTFTQGVSTAGLNARTAGLGRENIAARDKVSAMENISGQQRAVKQLRGQRRTEVFGQLRDKERQFALEQKAFGLKGAELSLDQAYKNAKLGIDQQRADAYTYGQTKPDDPEKPESPYTQDKRVTMRDTATSAYENALGDIKRKKMTGGKYKGRSLRGIQTYGEDGTPAQWLALTNENEAQIRRYVGSQGVKNKTLRAAVAQQLIYGDVGKATYEAVRKLGINPKSIGLKKRGKK